MTPAELAERTGTAERYVCEWLNANAASNYLQYHADSQPIQRRRSRPSFSERMTLRFTCQASAGTNTNWISALEGVEEKWWRGARVGDVGCGHGASAILMAKAYPASQFKGFDYHEGSIQRAREQADRAGGSNRVTFDIAPAKDFPGTDYDLVAFFDCLHDMGDTVGAAQHVRQSLASDGTWMLVTT